MRAGRCIEPDIWLLENTIMPYPWGSREAIPEILGRPSPSEIPQAELWMGAHPKAPSRAIVGSRLIPLPELIEDAPAAVLGETVAAEFDGRLPFLFKILAAERPLSIQAHPSREQARLGFEREELLGIPLSSPERNYRDRNHKPEVLCALSPFQALRGFRPHREILRLWSRLACPPLEESLASYSRNPDPRGLKRFFEFLMRLKGDRRLAVLNAADAAASKLEPSAERRWYLRLRECCPGDIGILSIFLLNLIELEPGQAIFSEAGVLHAYLEGTGVELMANSDNVLRGGLTGKHIDLDELLATVHFEPDRARKIEAEAAPGGELVYSTPFREFALARLELDGRLRIAGRRSVEIWIVLEGSAEVRRADGDGGLDVRKGDSFLVPAALAGYSMSGKARLFRATVPNREENP